MTSLSSPHRESPRKDARRKAATRCQRFGYFLFPLFAISAISALNWSTAETSARELNDSMTFYRVRTDRKEVLQIIAFARLFSRGISVDILRRTVFERIAHRTVLAYWRLKLFHLSRIVILITSRVDDNK